MLAAQKRIDYQIFLFCNVGDDSENPDTIKYVNDIAAPYAKEHGIKLIEIQKTLRDGTLDTIYSRLMKPDSRSIGIPVRMSNGAPGNRSCTADFKVLVVDKWLKDHGVRRTLQSEKNLTRFLMKMEHDLDVAEYTKEGFQRLATFPRPLARVGLGISLDEFQRVKPNMDPDTMGWKENVFPLIDLRMSRQDCMNVIRNAGLPVPPKSSCWFCPYHRLSVWQDMRENQPELFWKSAKLEEGINVKRAAIGKDNVWLTRKLIPLAMATTELTQHSLFKEDEDDMCESGYCHM